MKDCLCILLLFLIAGCSNGSRDKDRKTSLLAAKDIYPIGSYILEQRRQVDALKPAIVQFKTVNNKIDTALITFDEFNSLASDFLKPDITDSAFDGKYEESSFADQSIGSITLTYTALEKDLEIRRVDVLVEKNAAMEDKVRSIYVEKINNNPGRSVNKKLFWRSNKYFQVLTNTIAAGGQAQTEQLKVVWDPTDQ